MVEEHNESFPMMEKFWLEYLGKVLQDRIICISHTVGLLQLDPFPFIASLHDKHISYCPYISVS